MTYSHLLLGHTKEEDSSKASFSQPRLSDTARRELDHERTFVGHSEDALPGLPTILPGKCRDVEVPEESRHYKAHFCVSQVLSDTVPGAGRERLECRFIV